MKKAKLTTLLLACCAAFALLGANLAQAGKVDSHRHHKTTPRATASAGQERPRETLFMSAAQSESLWARYNECLAASVEESTTGGQPATAGPQAAIPAYKLAERAGERACHGLEPRPPWQWDAHNPAAPAFAGRVVDCLRAAGVAQVEVIAPGPGEETVEIALGGAENEQASIDLGLTEMGHCEHVAAGQG